MIEILKYVITPACRFAQHSALKYSTDGSRIGETVFLWADYPQSLIAARLALNAFGTSRIGIALSGIFVVVPLITKSLTQLAPEGKLHSVAQVGDHLSRIASKVMLLVMTLSKKFPTQRSEIGKIFNAAILIEDLFRQSIHSLTYYGMSKIKSYYLYCKWNRDW